MDPQVFSGKYRTRREIAKGGMGVIYHAVDLTLEREVALKVLHPQFSSDPAFVQRFLREARAMARLDHLNIMKVFEVEEDGGVHYIVMEYSPGRDLKHVLREEGPLALDRAVRIGIQMADALAYAHRKHIIHRDIKPGNMMLVEDDFLKLTDFGIAAALDESSVTATGTIIGTPEYMSPEQARGEPVDAKSDFYSLGLVLYEMLTGKTPYKGVPGHSVVGKLAYDPEEPSLTFPGHCPTEIQDLIRTLTRKQPNERPETSDTIINTLKAHLSRQEFSTTYVAPDRDATVTAPEPTPTLVHDELSRPQHPPTPAREDTSDRSQAPADTPIPAPDPPHHADLPAHDTDRPPLRWMPIAASILGVFLGMAALTYVLYQWPFTSESPDTLQIVSAPPVPADEDRGAPSQPTQETPAAPRPSSPPEPSPPLATQVKPSKPSPPDHAQEEQIRGLTHQLEALRTDYLQALNQHTTTGKTLVAQQKSLLTSTQAMIEAPGQSNTSQRFETTQQSFQSLVDDITTYHNSAEQTIQHLSERTRTLLKHAESVVNDKHTPALTEPLRLAMRQVKTVQHQLASAHSIAVAQWDSLLLMARQTLEQAKAALTTFAKQEQREAEQRETARLEKEQQEQLQRERDEAAHRLREQEAEQARHMEQQQLLAQKQSHARQKALDAALTDVEAVTGALAAQRQDRQIEHERLMDKGRQILNAINGINTQSSNDIDQGSLESAQQQHTELNQTAHAQEQQTQATAQTLLERAQALLTRLETLADDMETNSQRQQLTSARKQLYAAKNEFLSQNTTHVHNWDDQRTKISQALARKQELFRLEDERRRIELAEAQKAEQARLERERIQQEARGRAQAEHARIAARETEQLHHLLEHFQRAYQNHDVAALKRITDVDTDRERNLRLMFKTYPTIEVTTTEPQISDTKAVASLLILKLIDRTGQHIEPNPIVRETTIEIPKTDGAWGKIQW